MYRQEGRTLLSFGKGLLPKPWGGFVLRILHGSDFREIARVQSEKLLVQAPTYCVKQVLEQTNVKECENRIVRRIVDCFY